MEESTKNKEENQEMLRGAGRGKLIPFSHLLFIYILIFQITL